MKYGEHQGRVSQKTIAALQKELRRTGFTSLAYNCCNCGAATDLMVTTIFYDFGVTEQGTLVHVSTCSQAPEWLGALEDRIDKLLDTEQFIGTLDWREKNAGPVDDYL
jgi:hypothetical protein